MKWITPLLLFNAVVGLVVIGAGAMSGATWAPKDTFLLAFAQVFIPAMVIWLLVCHGAYKGMTSDNAWPRLAFWVNVLVMVFIFPVGTAIVAVMFWLRHRLKSEKAGAP